MKVEGRFFPCCLLSETYKSDHLSKQQVVASDWGPNVDADGSALWKRAELLSSILTTFVGRSLRLALIMLNLSEFLALKVRRLPALTADTRRLRDSGRKRPKLQGVRPRAAPATHLLIATVDRRRQKTAARPSGAHPLPALGRAAPLKIVARLVR